MLTVEMGRRLCARFNHFGCFVGCGICMVVYALAAQEKDEATLFKFSFKHGKGRRKVTSLPAGQGIRSNL
jgi:hypothetical protein